MKEKLQTIGQYLVSKNGAKYIKLEQPRGKNAIPVEFPLVLEVGDLLFVSIHDDEFREKYNVPDFVRGTVSLKRGDNSQPKKPSKPAPVPETGDVF